MCLKIEKKGCKKGKFRCPQKLSLVNSRGASGYLSFCDLGYLRSVFCKNDHFSTMSCLEEKIKFNSLHLKTKTFEAKIILFSILITTLNTFQPGNLSHKVQRHFHGLIIE